MNVRIRVKQPAQHQRVFFFRYGWIGNLRLSVFDRLYSVHATQLIWIEWRLHLEGLTDRDFK